jgi:4-amino-4-deoxy-L-arabinose transferase-like glycosyltransferase
MRPLTAVLMLMLVAAPWYVAVGLRTEGDFLREFFLEHNFNRARVPLGGHHGPIFYYIFAAMLGFFPWSIFFLPTCLEAIRALRGQAGANCQLSDVGCQRREAPKNGLVFCCCWVAVWIGVFSLAQTKLPSYITPCYPPLALLTAFFCDRWVTGLSRISPVWPKVAFGVLGFVGAAMLIAMPWAARWYLPGEEWLAAIGLIPLLGAVGGFMAFRRERRLLALSHVALAAILLSVGLFAVVAQRVAHHQQIGHLLAAIAQRSADPNIGAFGCLEPSWVYYARRPVRELTVRRKSGLAVQRATIDEFFANSSAAFVITTRRHLGDLISSLPTGVEVLAEAPYFLKDDQLVVLGHTPDGARTAQQPSTNR